MTTSRELFSYPLFRFSFQAPSTWLDEIVSGLKPFRIQNSEKSSQRVPLVQTAVTSLPGQRKPTRLSESAFCLGAERVQTQICRCKVQLTKIGGFLGQTLGQAVELAYGVQ